MSELDYEILQLFRQMTDQQKGAALDVVRAMLRKSREDLAFQDEDVKRGERHENDF